MTAECLDDLGTAWQSCTPRKGDTWRSSTNSEARLFAQLDAVLTCPNLESRLETTFPELETPEQFFSHVLVAASIPSEKGRQMLESFWAAAIDHDDEVAAAITEGIWRSSRPDVVDLARARLSHPDARMRASAINVLNARGQALGDESFDLLS
ncbi:MAG TPA: HEAT repeat domain-containing protein, partial [Polyangiaceae bacterium]